MARKKLAMDELVKKTDAMAIKSNDKNTSNTNNYYLDLETNIGFARLEKGLLLFIYTYETVKADLSTEMLFWDHRICVDTIKTGNCLKTSDQCRREHNTSYRQPNLCSHWYINDRCTFGTKCQNSHQLEQVPHGHRYIRTEVESNVFKLVRFIRNFAGHYVDSAINDSQQLYKDVLVVMAHLVHVLSRKNVQSIEHLHLFLEKTTLNQMIPEGDLLVELEKPYNVPEIFFDLRLNYSAAWYRPNGNRREVNFNELSPVFVNYFNRIFVEYFQGRLKSRGAKAAWS